MYVLGIFSFSKTISDGEQRGVPIGGTLMFCMLRLWVLCCRKISVAGDRGLPIGELFIKFSHALRFLGLKIISSSLTTGGGMAIECLRSCFFFTKQIISAKIAITHTAITMLVTVAMIMLVAGSIAVVVVLSMTLMVAVLVTELLMKIGRVSKVLVVVVAGVVGMTLVMKALVVMFV